MEKEKFAYYLAGKAFAMAYLGGHVFRVTIKPNEDGTFNQHLQTPQLYQYNNANKRTMSKYARYEIISTFAGYPGTQIYDFHGDDEYQEEDFSTAWYFAQKYAYMKWVSSIPSEEFYEYMNSWKRKAKRIIYNNWPYVAKLAKLLLERETLSGDEIKEFCDSLPKGEVYMRWDFRDQFPGYFLERLQEL